MFLIKIVFLTNFKVTIEVFGFALAFDATIFMQFPRNTCMENQRLIDTILKGYFHVVIAQITRFKKRTTK